MAAEERVKPADERVVTPYDTEFIVPELPGSSFPEDMPITIVKRAAWGARPPRDEFPMHFPILNVRYSYEDLERYDDYLTLAMRKCQDYYMDEQKLTDVPWNFLIYDGGIIFEGRGWISSPASVGLKGGSTLDIAFIGNGVGEHNPPSFYQCEAALNLIKDGIKREMVHPQYVTIPILHGKHKTYRQQKFF